MAITFRQASINFIDVVSVHRWSLAECSLFCVNFIVFCLHNKGVIPIFAYLFLIYVQKTFQQTIRGSIWKFLLGSFGSGIALLLVGKNLWELSIPNSVLLGAGLVIFLFVLRFLYFLMINVANYIHNIYVDSIWGNAIILLKNAYPEIHYINRKDELSDHDFMTTMIIFCNILKDIFDKKQKLIVVYQLKCR